MPSQQSDTNYLLALDASSHEVSIALLKEAPSQKTEELFYCNKSQERTDSSVFFQELEHTITIKKPNYIVVGIGPGSYNGLRSSIAAAQGMASACHARLIGIPSLFAFEEAENECWVAGNARGGQYWLARVQQQQLVEQPQLLSPKTVERFLAKHPNLPLISSTPLPELSSAVKIILKTPDARILARLAHHQNMLPSRLEPLYLKAPHTTPARTS